MHLIEWIKTFYLHNSILALGPGYKNLAGMQHAEMFSGLKADLVYSLINEAH